MLTSIYFIGRVVYPRAFLTSYNLRFTRPEPFFNYDVSKLFNLKIQSSLVLKGKWSEILKCLNSVKCKGLNSLIFFFIEILYIVNEGIAFKENTKHITKFLDVWKTPPWKIPSRQIPPRWLLQRKIAPWKIPPYPFLKLFCWKNVSPSKNLIFYLRGKLR